MAFTFFFRDISILELIARQFIPQMTGFSKIRVWDAGCAMGPEPFSLAIILAEQMGHFMFRNLRIDATDIDEQDQFGKIIMAGEYKEELVKRIPRELLDKYFEAGQEPGAYRLVSLIRERVQFQKHDLLTLKPIGTGYHLILCKNVLLHFSPELRLEVLKMFHASLAPDGFLATEQTQKIPPELSGLFRQTTGEGQLFQKAL
jgi:chemotaxis protein methyltransferase CheR